MNYFSQPSQQESVQGKMDISLTQSVTSTTYATMELLACTLAPKVLSFHLTKEAALGLKRQIGQAASLKISSHLFVQKLVQVNIPAIQIQMVRY